MTLYEILGVAPTATPDEIKAAYRRLAKETHPDRGGDREKFHQVQHAYDVLSDEERRARYDECGDEGGAATVPSATEILAQAFDVVLTAPPHQRVGTPLALLKIVLEERVRSEQRELAEHEREAKRYRKMIEALERKSGDAVLEMVLERRMRPHVQGAEMARGWIEGVQAAIELLRGYRYRTETADVLKDVLMGMAEDHLEERPRRRGRRWEGV